MFSRLIYSITAIALALAVHASIPGWSSAAIAASPSKKCTAKSHRHVKVVAAKIAPRGAGLSQQRRSPDVQVISFGP